MTRLGYAAAVITNPGKTQTKLKLEIQSYLDRVRRWCPDKIGANSPGMKILAASEAVLEV